MNKNRAYLSAIFASRKSVLAGYIKIEGERNGAKICVVPLGGAKSHRVKLVVEAIFKAGAKAGRLAPAEWTRLLESSPTPAPDDRWSLLIKLAVRPRKGWSGVRDQFLALPDGAAFSLRLLLLDARGGRRKGTTTFAELPDVAKLMALQEALCEEVKQGTANTDKNLALSLQERLDPGNCLGTIKALDVRRLRDRVHEHHGKDLFPNRIVRRRRQQLTDGTAGGKKK